MSQLGHIKTLAHRDPATQSTLYVLVKVASSSPTDNSWAGEREREREREKEKHKIKCRYNMIDITVGSNIFWLLRQQKITPPLSSKSVSDVPSSLHSSLLGDFEFGRKQFGIPPEENFPNPAPTRLTIESCHRDVSSDTHGP